MEQKIIVEVGMLLDKDLDYYAEMLENNGFKNCNIFETHDIYYTNKSYDELCNLSENQIKNACIRIRDCLRVGGTEFESGTNFENNNPKNKVVSSKSVTAENLLIFFNEQFNETFNHENLYDNNGNFLMNTKSIFDDKIDRLKIEKSNLHCLIDILENAGWYVIFDTFKTDFHYKREDIKSIVQIQEIDDIGLVVYYDNPEFYQMNENLQRISLLEELNEFGFELNPAELGIDKLRTLLLGYTAQSPNQNG